METKVCNKCGKKKQLSGYNKNKSYSDCRRGDCRKCQLKYQEAYNIKNSDHIKEYQREYRDKNHEFLKAQNREYNKNNKDKAMAYRMNNRDRLMKNKKTWNKKNKEHVNKYMRDRLRSDPVFRLNCSISKGIRKSLKGKKNGCHWEDMVGYTVTDLIKHLESLFLPRMTWENHTVNGWHIDHIIPIASFDITSADSGEFRACWALNNLQPLWAIDNLKKGAKLPE